MSELSPTDCAVAIRSFGRRLQEALGTDQPTAGPGQALVRLLDQEHAALSALRLAPDRPALADLVDAVPVRAWVEHPEALSRLRTAVAEAGRLVRDAEQGAEADDEADDEG